MQFIDTSKVKKLLNDYSEEGKYIELQSERLDRLNTKLYTIGSPELSTMPKSSSLSNDKITNLIIKRDEVKSKLDELIQKHEEGRKYINVFVEQISSPRERMVLQMRYIDREQWADITFALFGDKEDYIEKEGSYLRNVYYIHGYALCNMQRVMDGQNGQQISE